MNKWHIGALIFNITAWLRPFHNRWLEESEIYQLVVNPLDIWYLFYIDYSLHFFPRVSLFPFGKPNRGRELTCGHYIIHSFFFLSFDSSKNHLQRDPEISGVRISPSFFSPLLNCLSCLCWGQPRVS